jgi:small subunit ribosomal protein S20
MPNHKSAEKRDRQNAKRNAVNASNRTRLRSQIRKLRELIAKGAPQDALDALPTTISVIDKSVQKGVLHRNAAARHKARLTAHVNHLQAK